jgi:hypothetical protein
MKEFALIDEDKQVVHLATFDVNKTVEYDDFLKRLSANAKKQIDIRPRWLIACSEDRSRILAEFAPEWRTLQTASWFGNEKNVKILFPWTYFYMEFRGSSTVQQRIFFRNTPVDKTLDEMERGDETEKLYYAPLSNVYSGGSNPGGICMGSTFNYSRVKGRLISDRVNSFVKALFESNWNSDLDGTHHDLMPAEIVSHASKEFGYNRSTRRYTGELFDAWADLSSEGRFSFQWNMASSIRDMI